jgi:hypothetical protein
VVVLTRQTVTDIPTAAIAAVSLGLLLWREIPGPVFVGLGAITEFSCTKTAREASSAGCRGRTHWPASREP